MRPVEGTILTVARGAAEGARSAAEAGKALVEVAEASRDAAADALAATPSLLPGARAGRGGRRRGDRLPAAVWTHC